MKIGKILLLGGSLLGLLFLSSGSAWAYEKGQERALALDKIEVKESADGLIIVLSASHPLNYTVYEATGPSRLILDLIGTNVYSQGPAKMVLNKPYLKEVNLRWFGKAPEKEGEAGKVDLLEIIWSQKLDYKVKAKGNQILLNLLVPAYQPMQMKAEELIPPAVPVKLEQVNVEEKFEWEKWVELGLSHYRPLQISEEQVELARLRVREAERQLFPVTVVKGSEVTGTTTVKDVGFTERSFGVQLEQPLTYAGELRYKLDQTLVNLDISQKEYERIKSDYILEVKRSYYNLLLYIMNADIYEGLFKEANQILNLAKKQFEQKLITQVEFLNVQALLSQVKYQLVAAEKDLALAELTFKQVLNLDLKSAVQIEPWMRFEKLDVDLKRCQDIALKNRPELDINEMIVKFNELGIKAAGAKEKFKLSVSGFLGRSGSAYDTETLTMKTDWFVGLKLSKPLGGNTLTTTLTKEETVPKLSLTQEKTSTFNKGFEFSLVDGLNRLTEKKTARIELNRSLNELWEIKETVLSEVQSAFSDYQKILYQIQNVAERIEFQKKRAEITEVRWKVNEASLSDILEAKIAYEAERAFYNNLVANYYVAINTLTRACGLYKYAELVQGRSGEVAWHRVKTIGEDYALADKSIFVPKESKDAFEKISLNELSEGRIIAVNNEHGFAIVNLGEVQGVKEGTEFWVYRNREKVATLKASRSRKTTSSCKIARAEAGAKIRLGDAVKLIP